ncbi:MAG: HNH endonuclease [Bacteroidaceae bacterium]|nr:HNH endonuclease [Bacteroidaceae bacterium]
MVDINDFTREITCEYKGEVYSVRDNGAVMRHQREGHKARKLDGVWTFGTKSKDNGYMLINSHRVHLIVATAFIPGNEDGKMVVDHKDTNRCNNRVENLRWLTRLENVLLNEATLKRVTYLCGGDINKFINNPSCLQDLSGGNQDILWMRTVSAEEARKAWEHISAWAKRPSSTYKMMQKKDNPTKDFDEWLECHHLDSNVSINHEQAQTLSTHHKQDKNNDRHEFGQTINPYLRERTKRDIWQMAETPNNDVIESLTKGVYQTNFNEKLEFPLCPDSDISNGLEKYAQKVHIGDVIARNENGGEYIIKDLGWTWEWDAIQVVLKGSRFKPCIHIKYEDGKFIHSEGEYKNWLRFCDSPNVLQCGASTLFSFPACPKEGNFTLEEYADILQKGTLFNTCIYSKGYVYDREITKTQDGKPMLYVGVKIKDSLKGFGDTYIIIENGKIIHQIGNTYFSEKFPERAFCKMRGQYWNDEEEIIDDYC